MQGLRAHARANAHSGLRGPRSPARGPERSRPSTVLHPTTPLCPTQCLGAPSLLLDAPLPAGPPSIQGRGSNPLSLPTVLRSTLILQGRLHQGQVEPEASRSLRPPVPAGPDAALLAFRLPPRPHTLPGRPASERTLNPACHADSSHLPGRSRHRSRRGHRHAEPSQTRGFTAAAVAAAAGSPPPPLPPRFRTVGPAPRRKWPSAFGPGGCSGAEAGPEDGRLLPERAERTPAGLEGNVGGTWPETADHFRKQSNTIGSDESLAGWTRLDSAVLRCLRFRKRPSALQPDSQNRLGPETSETYWKEPSVLGPKRGPEDLDPEATTHFRKLPRQGRLPRASEVALSSRN